MEVIQLSIIQQYHYKIKHYQKDGSVKEIVFSQIKRYHIDRLEIISNHEIIILMHYFIQDRDCFTDILQWNFITNTKIIIPLQKLKQSKLITSQLFIFPDSKLFCIYQSTSERQFKVKNRTKSSSKSNSYSNSNSKSNSNSSSKSNSNSSSKSNSNSSNINSNNNRSFKIKLTYLNYPLQSPQDKPVHFYQIYQTTNISTVKQFDRYSGVCLIALSKFGVQNQFYVYSLKNGFGKHQARKFKFQFQKEIDRDYFTADIAEIWSPRKDAVYIKYALKVNQQALTTKMGRKLEIANDKYMSLIKRQQNPTDVTQNSKQLHNSNFNKNFNPKYGQLKSRIYKQAQQKYCSKQRYYHFIWQPSKNKTKQINLQLQLQPQQIQKLYHPIQKQYVAIQFTNRLRNTNLQFLNPEQIQDRLMFNTSLLQTRELRGRQITMLPIFYVEIDTWTVKYVDFSRNKLNHNQFRFSNMSWNFPAYDGGLFEFSQMKYEKEEDSENPLFYISEMMYGQQKIFKVNKTKVRSLPYCISTVTAHLIAAVCDQIDDDLLFAAVQLIVS